MIASAIRTELQSNPRLYNPMTVHRAYGRYKRYTMISRSLYVTNLKLARMANPIAGAVVECGTWKGGMSAGIAAVLGTGREYFLFDSFEGLPVAQDVDGSAAIAWQQDTESPGYYDNCTAAETDAIEAMSIAGVPAVSIVKGWFNETLPTAEFGDGIALLRLDADWYESTRQILDSLFPLVNAGGLIIIDDYDTWDGCSKAVHDYLSEHQRPERISHFGGVCFMRKRSANP